MLAGDADRDRTVQVLKTALTEGRLTEDEFTDRMGRALQARTFQELDKLTDDIPKPGPTFGAPPYPPRTLPPHPTPRWTPPPPVVYASPGTNGKAIASLVCAVMLAATGGIGSVTAVILGHSARQQIRQTGQHGSGMATAGLVFGYLGVFVWTLIFLAAVSG